MTSAITNLRIHVKRVVVEGDTLPTYFVDLVSRVFPEERDSWSNLRSFDNTTDARRVARSYARLLRIPVTDESL